MKIVLFLFIFCASVSSFSSQNSGGTWAIRVADQDISIVRENPKLNVSGRSKTRSQQLVNNSFCSNCKYTEHAWGEVNHSVISQ